MKRSHVLIFGTTLPDDREEDENDIVVFPGHNVAVAIAEHVKAIGLRAQRPVSLDDAGWEMAVRLGRGRTFFRINYLSSDEIIVPVWYEGPLLDRLLRRPDPAFPDFVGGLAAQFRTDARFVKPKWHRSTHNGEYDKVGTDDPEL